MNNKPLTEEYYIKQRKLYDEMISRKPQHNASVLTNKQKYGNNKLSIESSQMLLLQIAELLYLKIIK